MKGLAKRQADARTTLVDALRDELLGPSGGEDEELNSWERPTLRYLIGRLAPANTEVPQEEDEGSAEAESDSEDADTGYASPLSMAMNPSSIGISFLTEPGVKNLEVTMRWGTYEPSVKEELGKDDVPKANKVHRRVQKEHILNLDLTAPKPFENLDAGVRGEFLVRRQSDGRSAASVFLVNRIESVSPERPEDHEWLFQPEILVRASDGKPAFAPRTLEDVVSSDPDLVASELLYWNRPEFAVGHGCAAEWISTEGKREPATEVRTEILPSYELARIDPRSSDAPGLDMRILGGSGPQGVPVPKLHRLLMPMVENYETWIGSHLTNELLPDVPVQLVDQAKDHISACESAHQRMIEGINLLLKDEDAQRAFCFANRAMALQRERSIKALARRRGESDPKEVITRWRPFQLAFILINLPPMVDRLHPHRDVADLLWFPTGGGKTEAYLGLTAFALAHRRLRKPIEGHQNGLGVTVLMRYTLRLLTVQQFQRATALICACEFLRFNEKAWGTERFTIGPWVGKSATPNVYSDRQEDWGAKEALERLARGQSPRRDGGSPVQLLNCPWCGAKLTHKEPGTSSEKPIPGTYQADDDSASINIFCANEACYFYEDSIPAHVVDEQVYRNVPSLVIATVDKFAQMPFNGKTQAFFGRIDRYCPRHGYLTAGEKHEKTHYASKSAPPAKVQKVKPLEPPDLIIQDELHLISGPLGTLVGLYETAIDLLASVQIAEERIGPKIIASTATIRRSEQQMNALFGRKVAVFPPSGIESTDSWFGTEISLEEEPGRLYLGISAPGKSVKTALVRVYAALLSQAKRLHDEDAEAADPYMTLVGYFNSLRELGGAIRLVEDDVNGRMNVLHRRDASVWPLRNLYEREELTSNKRAEEVPRILDKLERRFLAERPKAGQYPIDTILASNMISVGVDIDRLGLMVVNGQPKTSAEYIQATSRIGRQSPGLVLTVFNWTRPRDISHYERFRSYHGSLYRFVEATSVTPFSSRARDRGLEGVLTSLLRLGDSNLNGEQDAAKFDVSTTWVKEVVDFIARRAEGCTGDSLVGSETRDELFADLDRWTNVAEHDKLCYSRRGLGPKPKEKNPDKRYLIDSQEDRKREGTFVAPGSLREVESELHVHLLEAEKIVASGH